MKIRITTVLTATAAITFLTMRTLTSTAAQAVVSYPLDTAILQINGMVVGSMVRIKKVSDGTVLYAGTSSSLTLDYAGDINVTVRKGTGSPTYQEWQTVTTLTAGATTAITALQQLDE